jgi:alpha-L-fucosidase
MLPNPIKPPSRITITGWRVCALGLAMMAHCQALPKPDPMGVPTDGPFDYGVMGPPATPRIVADAGRALSRPLPPGPFEASWESIRKGYRPPSWFEDAKFGIFMHWGLYSVPAYRSEWYEKHMYGPFLDWHSKEFGPPERFGYKDFIPMFKAEKWDPEDWAELFSKSGARLVMPCAQHHDNFALWDSKVTRFNAKVMGPKRDLIGELGQAVRKRDMKFGVSNHGVENFTFINPNKDLDLRLREAKADLYDPQWAEFYNVADRSDAAMTRFLTDWTKRNFELIDNYQPDILWFDNGVNLRVLDPLKLLVAAYYYNRAAEWRKEVSISTKYVAYAPSNKDDEQIGSIIDFEKIGKRSPAGIRPGPWKVDDPIGSTWGYTKDMRISSAEGIIGRLVDTVSKGGFYLLNISPMADGTIPEDQRKVLLGIGDWLRRNGEAIYGSRPWTQFGDDKIRFTTKGTTVYAIGPFKKGEQVIISPLSNGKGMPEVGTVGLVGGADKLEFVRNGDGLLVTMPGELPAGGLHSLRITP